MLGLPTYLRQILPSAIFSLGFYTWIMYAFLIYSKCEILPANPNSIKLNLSTGLYPKPIQSSHHRYQNLMYKKRIIRNNVKGVTQENELHVAQRNKHSLLHVLNCVYHWFDYWNISGSSAEIATSGTHNGHNMAKQQAVLRRTNHLLSEKRERERTVHYILSIWYYTDLIENTSSKISSIVAWECVYRAAA
jgi:hypothetical protein